MSAYREFLARKLRGHVGTGIEPSAMPTYMKPHQQDATAREAKDERHLCPLQLDVIERAIVMWSNEGDTVLSPFAGIGSEGYVALNLRRKFVGVELKASYFKQQCENLVAIDAQTDIFASAVA